MTAPSENACPSSAALWAILESRDDALRQSENLHQHQIAALQASLAGTRNYLEVVEKDRADRLTALESMQAQLAEHGLARHHAETRVAELSALVAELQNRLAAAEGERDTLRARLAGPSPAPGETPPSVPGR